MPGISLTPDEWMKHRINLFLTFTLPSVMNQTNQNFTWIVLMDDMTPQVYRDILSRIKYPNLKLVYTSLGKTGPTKALLNNIEGGQYDLITTRLDNDDAIHKKAVNDIQTAYLQNNSAQPNPWAIGLPMGCTLDLASKKMYITEYPNNAYVSLVEDSQDAKSVWQCQHGEIPNKFNCGFIMPTPYWIIIIHSQNLANNISSNAGRTIYTDKEVDLRVLSEYGIDANHIDAMSKLTIEEIRHHSQKASAKKQKPVTI